MVMEMKQGFSTAMEELSKIQYGDQNLEQQLADNKKECAAEVKVVTDVVEELKVGLLIRNKPAIVLIMSERQIVESKIAGPLKKSIYSSFG